MYETLVSRNSLHGVHRFSRAYFKALARMPEFVSFGAFVDGRLASCQIWLTHDRYAYSHLAASSDQGYTHRAAYAVYTHGISFFKNYRLIDLGGTPDKCNLTQGLARFKKGFANDTRQNWICCAISDRNLYEFVCHTTGANPGSTSYFPAYREQTLESGNN